MRKRGQVAVFIVLGLVVLLASGLFLLNSQRQELPSRFSSEQELSAVNAEGLAIQGLVNSCLKQKFLEGKEYYGLGVKEEEEIEAYIESTLPQCADLTSFTSKGLKVQAGKPTATVTITEQAAVAEVQYPITVFSGKAKAEMSRFDYYMKPESTMFLMQDTEGRTISDALKQASDGLAELKIPAGTSVMKEGRVLGEVSMKVIDRNFEGLDNGVVLGEVVYEGLPEGAEFEPAIEVTIRYDDDDIPPAISEEDLAIAYYDKEAGMWLSLDSLIDTENNKVTASVSHFSPFAIVIGCGEGDEAQNRQEIYFGYLYREPCYREGVLCPEWGGRNGNAIYDENPGGYDVRKEFEQSAESICYEADWDEDGDEPDSTPPTFGYEDINKIGSKQGAAKFEFHLAHKGNTCAREGKSVTIEVNCDDECTDFRLNNNDKPKIIGVRGEVSKSYTLEFPAAALKTGLDEGKENVLSFTVNNKRGACSGAEGVLTLQGQGAFRNCPEGENTLIQGCRCGAKNIGVIYDKEKLTNTNKEIKDADSFVRVVGKEPAILSPQDKELLGAVVAEGKELYCYKGALYSGKSQLERAKKESVLQKPSFDSLVKDKDVQECCSQPDASIYPDEKDGCETITCRIKNDKTPPEGVFYWVYTGNKPDGTQPSPGQCRGTGGDSTALLLLGCGQQPKSKTKPGVQKFSECKEGVAAACIDDKVVTCDTATAGTGTIDDTPCQHGCESGKCRDAPEFQECNGKEANTKVCKGNTPIKCVGGKRGEPQQPCRQGTVCAGAGACVSTSSAITSPECMNEKGAPRKTGERICSSASKKYIECSGIKGVADKSTEQPCTRTCWSEKRKFRRCLDSCSGYNPRPDLVCESGKQCCEEKTALSIDNKCCYKAIATNQDCDSGSVYYAKDEYVCATFEQSYAVFRCQLEESPAASQFKWQKTSNTCRGCCKCTFAFDDAQGRKCEYNMEGKTHVKGSTYSASTSTDSLKSCEAACGRLQSVLQQSTQACSISVTAASHDNTNSCTPTDVP